MRLSTRMFLDMGLALLCAIALCVMGPPDGVKSFHCAMIAFLVFVSGLFAGLGAATYGLDK